MADYVDIGTWSRRDALNFFRTFDKPTFNVCVRLDVARLKRALADAGRPAGLSLACYYIALRLANEQQPLRLRLEGDRVRVHDRVDGSCTVLRDDGDSFGFANFDYQPDFARFAAAAGEAVRAARSASTDDFAPRPDDVARLYFTTLPWVHFTSFSHARLGPRAGQAEDSVPRLAFGRADGDGARLWMPMSVEVHHGLMDGVHVGRFVQGFEAALQEPAALLGL